jgi:hypothetical protein
MKKVCFVVFLGLAGCVTTPVVSDFNGSSVKIQESFGSAEPSDATKAEAARICSKVGKKAESASYRQVDDFQMEYLFLCL